jgi:hypothetical protein
MNISNLTMMHSKTEKGRALTFNPVFLRAVAKEVLTISIILALMH